MARRISRLKPFARRAATELRTSKWALRRTARRAISRLGGLTAQELAEAKMQGVYPRLSLSQIARFREQTEKVRKELKRKREAQERWRKADSARFFKDAEKFTSAEAQRLFGVKSQDTLLAYGRSLTRLFKKFERREKAVIKRILEKSLAINISPRPDLRGRHAHVGKALEAIRGRPPAFEQIEKTFMAGHVPIRVTSERFHERMPEEAVRMAEETVREAEREERRKIARIFPGDKKSKQAMAQAMLIIKLGELMRLRKELEKHEHWLGKEEKRLLQMVEGFGKRPMLEKIRRAKKFESFILDELARIKRRNAVLDRAEYLDAYLDSLLLERDNSKTPKRMAFSH
ncbi:hypothetical protein HY546_03755 [archaeon]|nr:hypothetical protein [archaeon]